MVYNLIIVNVKRINVIEKEIAYAKYTNNEINEFELIEKIDLLQKTIKSEGVIYTPLSIVDFMIENSNPKREWTIVEPSCGHGMFVFAILNFMKNKYSFNGEQLFSWFIAKVKAYDIEEQTVFELKEILSLYFKKEFNLILNNEDFPNIIVQDGLFNGNNHFDLCIGNPPYIRTKNIEESYLKTLRQTYKSCEKGNIDIYYAFIEKYVKQCDRVCFITPNSFVSNVSGTKIKEILFPYLELFIDFKEKLIFKDARTYTCIFKTNKFKQNDELLYSNSLEEKVYPKNIIDVFKIKVKNDNNHEVLSGIATLCDSAYLVNKINGKYCANNNGVLYEIEEELIAPYLKLTKQQGNDINIGYMIFPYDRDNKIIKENEMEEKYPLAYTYLLSVKNEKLLKRDKGKISKYESWYAYGRKQGFYNIVDDKALIVPSMIGSNCQPKVIDIKELIKQYGRILFTSGYVIPLNVNNFGLCDFILSDAFQNHLLEHGKPWPGKSLPYYSLTAKQLKNITP